MFENEKINALKNISHQNCFVGAVFTRMVPTPLGWVFVFCFVLVFVFVFCFFLFWLFHVTSISVFISYLFHFQVYHGKCTDFFVVVNNVLGFAKKENKKNPFEFALE